MTIYVLMMGELLEFIYASKKLIPFLTTYLYITGYLTMTMIKNKLRKWLDILPTMIMSLT